MNLALPHTTLLLDRVPPKFFDCPLGQTAYLTGNATTVPVTWQRLVAWDNIDIVGPTVSTHEQGQQFGVGTHLVMYTARDQAGNNGTCAFNVTVEIGENHSFEICCMGTIRYESTRGRVDLGRVFVYELTWELTLGYRFGYELTGH